MRNAYENAEVIQRLLRIKSKANAALSCLKGIKNAIKADEEEYGDCVMVSDSAAAEMSNEFSGWGALKHISDKSTIADLKAAYIKLCKNIVEVSEEIGKDIDADLLERI